MALNHLTRKNEFTLIGWNFFLRTKRKQSGELPPVYGVAKNCYERIPALCLTRPQRSYYYYSCC